MTAQPQGTGPARLGYVLLESLAALLSDRLGLHFPENRRGDLERGVRSAARDLGFPNPESFVEALIASPWTRRQADILAGHLTVGETYFFRDRKSFEALETSVLPDLIRARGREKRLKVWSAGCCTGEEAYSLAILVRRLLPDAGDWNVTVLGTDVNPRFLSAAARGVYAPWSFRDPPPGLRERYFTETADGRFEILRGIRNMARFEYLNLAEDVYPSLANGTAALDLVLCRNVLMYFTPGAAEAVAGKLSRCLREGGWLLVGAVEASRSAFSPLAAVKFPDAVFYRKERARPEERRERYEPAFPPAVPDPRRPADLWTIPAATAATTPDPVIVEKEAPLREAGQELPREAPGTAFAAAQREYERGAYVRAAAILEPLLARGRRDAASLALLARVEANRGRLEEARSWCDRAIALDRTDAALRYLHATIALEQGREEDAEVSLKRAVYLDPDFVLAHFALGNLARRRERREDAARHFRNARTLARKWKPEEVLPDSDGITAERLVRILDVMEERGRVA